MSIQIQLEKEKLLLLWEKLQQHIRERFIVQGFNLHLKRRVQLQALSEHVVSAEVKGQSDIFHVQLHLNEKGFEDDQCTCPHNGKCRHAAALFFYLYATCGRPEMLMQDFYKDVAKKQKEDRQSKSKARRNIKRAEGAEDNRQGSSEQVDEWHRIFSEKVIEARILNETDPRRLWENILKVLDTSDAYPDELKVQPLYRFNIYIFILNKIEQLMMNADSALLSSDQGGRSYPFLQEILQQSRHTLKPDGWQSSAKYVMQTLDQITLNVLNSEETGLDWIHLYQIFIVQAANNAKRLERERLRLQGFIQASKLKADQKTSLRMMLAYLEMIEGNDTKALKWVTSGGMPSYSFMISILQSLYEQEAWDRMALWLQAMANTDALTDDELSELAPYWEQVSKRLGGDEAYEKWVKSCLPRSEHLYSTFLFQKKRFVEWIELQMIRGLGLADLNRNQLQEIERHKPELLLPLHHQEIERLILLKKRNTYKEAVERLQRLQQLYAQLGQEDRFKFSIEHISEKFKPFQALREEMTKGNLL